MMKTTKTMIVCLMLVGMTAAAQIKGNKEIITKEISTEGLLDFQMNLYAEVVIDMNAKAMMTITTDSNIMSLLDTEIVDGRLNLAQKEWIQASQPIKITIGSPQLKRLEVGVHETVILKNVNHEKLNLMALNGRIVATGTVNELGIGAENGTVDARDLKAQSVFLDIWGRGKSYVNASQMLESKLSDDAQLELVNQPAVMRGDIAKTRTENTKIENPEARYIDIKIKNNSWNRNHFAVKGPKQDGTHFGYGFPMMPGAVKKERWTVGTKIYKVNKLGLRKLLVKIKAEDQGQTVNLFQ